jgi:hypothetical protein
MGRVCEGEGELDYSSWSSYIYKCVGVEGRRDRLAGQMHIYVWVYVMGGRARLAGPAAHECVSM